MSDKIKAVMLGHAVGDALGVPAEFASRSELDNAPITDMEGFGTYPYPAGTWSDDTSMSLAALDVLKNGQIHWGEIMLNFVEWLQHDKYTATDENFDVGRTCENAITNYLSDIIKATESGEKGERSNGNGSLMRIHPFVLYMYYNQKSDMEIIHNASALTHGHQRSKIACGIYALILEQLLEKSEKESIYKGLENAQKEYQNYPEFTHYNRLFNDNFAKLKREEIKSTGYVVDTLEASLWCLLNTISYEECVLTAVNLGDDTDTVAAIAGSLAGALYGLDAIPEKWLNTLKKRDYIEKMCDEAGENWMK